MTRSFNQTFNPLDLLLPSRAVWVCLYLLADFRCYWQRFCGSGMAIAQTLSSQDRPIPLAERVLRITQNLTPAWNLTSKAKSGAAGHQPPPSPQSKKSVLPREKSWFETVAGRDQRAADRSHFMFLKVSWHQSPNGNFKSGCCSWCRGLAAPKRAAFLFLLCSRSAAALRVWARNWLIPRHWWTPPRCWSGMGRW